MVDLAPSLALSIRSAREASRGRSPYLARAGLLAGVGLAVLFTHSTASSAAFSDGSGATLLGAIVWIDFFAISLVGTAAFATLLVAEKEARTLDLLRLAGFSPWSIAIGKTAGTGLQLLSLLLLQIPFCLLAITLGGVSLTQIAATFAVLAAHAVTVFGIGVFASAVSTTRRQAYTRALLLLLGWCIYSSVMAGYLPTPLVCLIEATSWQGSLAALSILAPVLVGVLVGATFLFFAGRFIDESWAAEQLSPSPAPAPVPSPAVAAPARPTAPLSSVGEDAAPPPRRLAAPVTAASALASWYRNADSWGDGDPLRRKDFEATGGVLGLFLRIPVHSFAVVLFSAFVGPGVALFWIGLLGATLTGSSAAGTFLRYEVSERTWPLLYILPRGLGSVLGGKVLALMQALLPALCCIGLGLLIAPVTILEGLGSPRAAMLASSVPVSWYLSAYLSLRIEWGAFPIAFAAVVCGNLLLESIPFASGILAPALVLAALGTCVLLHRHTLALLRRAAADG